jgi:D-alanyl-D-alanine carboxypeptidase
VSKCLFLTKNCRFYFSSAASANFQGNERANKLQLLAAQARAIFDGLQRGTIDRSLFTSNANAYFSDQALKDFQSSLGPLGTPTGFAQTRTSLRGGMTYRSYRVTFPNQVLRVWTYEMPDGKLEQYQVAPIG